jgi:spermidine synthase
MKKKQSAQELPQKMLDLKILVLVAGAVLMSLEIVGSRLLAPHFGNSVFVWGSLISVFLTALSLGYWVGGHLADHNSSLSRLYLLCLIVAACIFLIPWVGHPLCRFLLTSGFGEQSGPLVAASILFLPPSFLLGIVSPFSVRIATQDVESVGRAAGSLYALSTIGSIVGTLCTTFILIPLVGVSWILKCLGIAMAVLPVILILLRGRKKTTAVTGLVIMAIGLSVPTALSYRLHADERVILDEDTPYHHLSVIDNAKPERFLRFDRFTESSIMLRPPYETTSEYTNYFQLSFLAQPNIHRALFVGAGGGIGPRAFLAVNPEMEIDVVDVDKRVLDIAENHFQMPHSPKLHPIVSDGRTYFLRSPAPYDCIVLDVFTIGGRIPFHMTTQEYFEVIRSHMTADGVFMMNINSSLTGERSAIYRAIGRTLQDVFPHVYAFAAGLMKDQHPEKQHNILFLCSMRKDDLSRETFLAALPNYPERTYITHTMLDTMISNFVNLPHDLQNTPPLTDELAPIETMKF